MPKRIVFHSTRRHGGWKVSRDGETVSVHGTQIEAETAAIKRARELWRQGILAQVKLHKKNGRIREERTYGNDPRRSKG